MLLATLVRAACGADYHFSALGSDFAGDGSLDNPWQLICKRISLNLEPGDSVLLRSVDAFADNILLVANDSATCASCVFGD